MRSRAVGEGGSGPLHLKYALLPVAGKCVLP